MPSTDRHPADLSPDLKSRRRAIRLAAPAELTVTLSDRRIAAEILDISHGGLGLLTNFPLSRGATYTLTFRFRTRVIRGTANAAHVRKHQDGGWKVGLAFVADEHLEALEQLVDELLSDLVQFS